MSNISKLIEKMKLNVAENDLKFVLYHSGCHQDSYLRQRNNAYTSLGDRVINSVSAIFLYNNFRSFSAGQMSVGIKTFKNYISNALYENYRLGDFVINPPNVEDNRVSVVSKIAGLIYKQCGFIKIYEMFLPYLKNFDPLDNKDYKTTLQEYAQDRKEVLVYEVIGTEGLEHEKIYKVRVRVGNKTAIGSAIGKKRATVEAAKNLIENYNIDYQISALRGNKTKTQNFSTKRSLSFARKKLLIKAKSELKIRNDAVTDLQMDEIFTHNSFLQENGNGNLKSNECLSVLGANILEMLCCDYIIENYNLENIVIRKKQSILVNEENLFKVLPDSVTDYLLTSSSYKKVKNNISLNRIKVAIFKSVLAAMWLNYTETASDKALNYAKKFAEQAFISSAKEKLLDYFVFLKEIIEKFPFSHEENLVELSKSSDNVTTWKVSLKVNGSDFSISSEGYGHTKKLARNLAAKESLALLFPYCLDDSEIKEQFLRIINPEELYLFEMRKDNHQEEIFTEDEMIQKNKLKDTQSAVKQSICKEISFDNAENVLYICKGIIFCNKHNHKIFSVTGILASLSGNPLKLNVNYCADCNMFFISYAEFKYYRDIYGILLGNYFIQENFNSTSGNYENLSAESILRLCGYTVNQRDNLTVKQRRLILSNLMDRKIITKPRIMSYLQFFINSSKYRDNMKIANQKWQEDLIWVRNYNIDTQKHFLINSIQKF